MLRCRSIHESAGWYWNRLVRHGRIRPADSPQVDKAESRAKTVNPPFSPVLDERHEHVEEEAPDVRSSSAGDASVAQGAAQSSYIGAIVAGGPGNWGAEAKSDG